MPNKGETIIEAVAGECSDRSLIRKVSVFNEDYRLKEKGAILNWFDITEVEGYCSLNTKISVIMENRRGKLTLALFLYKKFRKIKNKEGISDSKKSMIGKETMKMIGSFTILRATTLSGMVGMEFTKEELLDLNKKLNKIKIKSVG